MSASTATERDRVPAAQPPPARVAARSRSSSRSRVPSCCRFGCVDDHPGARLRQAPVHNDVVSGRRTPCGGRARSAEHEHPGVQGRALVQRRPQRPVQPVLEVERRPPTARRGRTGRRRTWSPPTSRAPQVEGALGGHELVQPHHPRRHVRPVARGHQAVVGVGTGVADGLEDHRASLGSRRVGPPARVLGRERRTRLPTASSTRSGRATPSPAPALELGAAVVDGEAHPDAPVRIPLAVMNRHGLVAGATGTGKTKTLQLMAEQLSAQGVPVFLADIKGDLSGMASPGEAGDRITARAGEVGQQWTAHGVPHRVPLARRPGRRHPGPRHGHVVRPDPAGQGARAQRHPGVQPRAGLPLRRQQRPARCSTSRTCARSSAT